MVTRFGAGRGAPGRSAVRGYDRARRLRRRGRVEAAWWLAVGSGAALGSALGPHRAGWAAVAGAALLAAWWRRPERDPERWLRGAAGEIATAELLDGLGRRRWAVLHDRGLPGRRANIDHLVIGRRGVWVVDSKAFRAPVVARWGQVHVGDRRLDVTAVRWEASVVAECLGVVVRPLVVIQGVVEHGGYLPRRGRRCGGVRVLPADGLVRHLRRARTGAHRGRADIAGLADRASWLLPER